MLRICEGHICADISYFLKAVIFNNYFIRLRDTQQECAKEDVANSLPEAENMLKAHEDLKVKTYKQCSFLV